MLKETTIDVYLYAASNSLEAHLLRGLLIKQGIKVRLQGECLAGAAGELPLDVLEVALYVPNAQFQAANRIIADYLEQANEQWYCPQCGEANTVAFEFCWHCGQGAPCV